MTTNDITNSAPVVRKAVDGSVIPAVKAVQVHKAFGPLHVLKGIDLTVMKPYDSKNVNIGETPVEALILAAHSEVATIGFYKSVKERITASTPTADIARKLLTKLIADESLHLKLLTRQLKVMAGNDKKYDELMKKILD